MVGLGDFHQLLFDRVVRLVHPKVELEAEHERRVSQLKLVRVNLLDLRLKNHLPYLSWAERHVA